MKKIIGLVCIILLASCAPEIVVHSPTDNQSYMSEAMIYIKATVTDNDGIKKVRYKIFFEDHTIDLPSHPTSYELDEASTMQSLGSGNSTTLTIVAEDVGGNVTTKSITLYNS